MSRPLRVLIVEDVEDDALLILRELRRSGWEPDWELVETRQAMAEALDRRDWDVVISDFNLPGFGAPEALALCRQRGLAAPFLIASGSIDEEQAIDCLKAGASDFFLKDRLERLGPALERELARADQLRSRQAAEAERDRALAELKESEARYRALVDSVEEIVYAGDVTGPDLMRSHLTFVSSQAERMIGYAPEEFLASPDLWWKLVHPEDATELRETTERALSSGRPLLRLYRVKCREGRWRWLEDTLVPRLDGAGRAVGFTGTARDVTPRIEADRELTRQREFLQQVVDQNPSLIFVKDREGRFRLVNRALAELYGTTPEDVVGKTDADFSPNASEVAAFRRDDLEVMDSGRDKHIAEEPVTDVRGAMHWFSTVKRPLAGPRGENDYVLGVGTDITREREAAEALRASEARLQALLDALPDIVFLQSADGTLLHCHAPDPTVLGLAPERLVGRSMSEVLPSDAAARLGRAGAEALRTRQVQSVEYNHELAGQMHHYDARVAAAEDQMLITVVRDITARVDADQKMRDGLRELTLARERYERASEISKVGVWDWDLATDEIYLDPSLKALLGFRDDEIRNHLDDWGFRVHPEDAERVQAEATAHLDGAKPRYEVEHRMLHRDGSVRWFLARGQAIRDSAGKPVRIVGADLDITETRHLQAQLQKAQKMEAIGRLAGGISHDFNNILGVIVGYSELLLKRLDESHSERRKVEEIHAAAERAALLTRQLLAFSRRQVLQPTRVDMNAAVTDLEPMLTRLIGEDVRVALRLADELRWVTIDRSQLDQVIMNLAVNARDAMPSGGTLVIETANADLDEEYARSHPNVEPGGYVRIVVSDTGHGMDAETVRNVFEPFFTTKEEGKGTGLGLAIVHGVVHQSGGHVEVYSAVGRGTSFKLYFPAVEVEDIPAGAGAGNLKHTHRGSDTILLVEDNEGLREVTCEMLEEAGYTVLTAEDAAAAETVLSSSAESVDLLITDVVMPGATGADLARRLARSHPGLEVLFMSGYTADAIGHHGVLDDAVHFIEKPFGSDALLRKIREVLDGGRAK